MPTGVALHHTWFGLLNVDEQGMKEVPCFLKLVTVSILKQAVQIGLGNPHM